MIATEQTSGDSKKIDSLIYKSKGINEEELKDLMEKMSINFDNRHSKVSLVKRTRRIFGDFLKIPTNTEKSLIVTNNDKQFNELLSLTLNSGLDISLSIKTYKTSLFDFSIGYGVTLPTLNQAIEKSSSMFDLKFKLEMRSYLWDLITSSTECVFDCNVYPGEFTFRYLDKPSKTVIELTMFK